MKKANLKQKPFLFFLIIVVTLLSSCSSDTNDDSGETATIIGKWHNYKRIKDDVTCTDISNLNYEFESNACIITEEGDVTNYVYKVDGDYIKYYDPKTEKLMETHRIISLTKEELVYQKEEYGRVQINYFTRM